MSQSSQTKLHKILQSLSSRVEKEGKFMMIYGAYGYTGKLILQILQKYHILQRHTILAGRSKQKLLHVMKQFQLKSVPEIRVFDVSMQNSIHDQNNDKVETSMIKIFEMEEPEINKSVKLSLSKNINISNVHVVLNCAGPFIHTCKSLIQSCAHHGASYLDITGEYSVFEYTNNDQNEETRQLQQIAKKKEIVIVPGVGFDVIPTDCMAKFLCDEFNTKWNEKPSEIKLFINFGSSTASQGTMKSMAENLGYPYTRKDGKLVLCPFGSMTEKVKLTYPHEHVKNFASVPWGDISTAYYTTEKVPNIHTYFPIPSSHFLLLFQFWFIQWIMMLILRIPLIISLEKKLIECFLPEGPHESENSKSVIEVFGYAKGKDDQKKVSARAFTSGGYLFTSETALVCALKALLGDVSQFGCLTPSICFGSDLLSQFDKCSLVLEK